MSWSCCSNLRDWVLCVVQSFCFLTWECSVSKFSLLIALSWRSAIFWIDLRLVGVWGSHCWGVDWLLAICGEWGLFLADKDVSKPQPKYNHKRTASEVEYFIEQELLLLVMSLFSGTDCILLIVLVKRNYSPSESRTFLMKQSYLPNQAVVSSHSGSRNFLSRKSYLPIATSYSRPPMRVTLHVVTSPKANPTSLPALGPPTSLPLLSLQRKPVIRWFLWVVGFPHCLYGDASEWVEKGLYIQAG